MAPIEKKRRHTDTQIYSGKKRKADRRIGHGSGAGPGASGSLDTLPWDEVQFPETFQDAGGFGGLEEISDIEVARHLGKLEFKLSSSEPKTNGQGKMSPPSGETIHHGSKRDRSSDQAKVDWEGFERLGTELGKPIQNTGTSLRKKAPGERDSRRSRLKGRKSRGEHSAQTNPPTSGNTFEPLVEDDDGMEDGSGEGDMSAWDSLNLSPETLSSLARMKFSQPTPIQVSALPHILAGNDAICKAPTGSGKTLGFGIPLREHFLQSQRTKAQSRLKNDHAPRDPPIALILSPTRELAYQLESHLRELTSDSNSICPRIATITGGKSMHKQQRLLATADIIIGTPGRLWEVIDGSSELQQSIKRVKFLVLDEADRLLSSGHFQEVEEILNALDRSDDDDSESGFRQERQTLVFSATFEKNLQQKLAGKSKSSGRDLGNGQSMEYLLKKLNFREEKPKFIDVNPSAQMAVGLREGIIECGETEKDLYLYSLLLHHPHTRTLVFTNSVSSVRRVTSLLQNLSLPAYPIHGEMPQKARFRSIERFSSPSSSSILIATDVAARGLDIPSIQLVVHYHVPRTADMYVHRSGRTARAERSGSSILLCAPGEAQGVHRLIAKVHARSASHEADNSQGSFMQTIELDGRIIARVKPRVVLSKKISDAALAKEKNSHEENWLKKAAEDLGVDYDSEEFAAGEGSKKGRGQGRKKREKEAREMTKDEVGALRAELKGLLVQRINVGVSERYLTAGGMNIDELLNKEKRGEFLGRVDDGMVNL